MSRCLEFYKKWERDPNWCEKCKDSVRKINRYIDLLDDFEAKGIPKDKTNVFLPEGAARPLLAISDPILKEKAIIKCRERLNGEIGAGRGNTKKLTAGDVAKIIRTVTHEDKIATAAQKLPDTIRLHHGDFLKEYEKLGKESIDCIITDPPYVNEWLDNYAGFAKAAEYVLKPGGFLITYIGHIHMDKILAQMTPYLEYYWIMMLKHAGPYAAVHSRSVQCGMKPILIFNKSPRMKPKRYFNDVIIGTGKEKDAHEWQQGEEELRQLFEPFTDPGDTILDPFMGSGTTISMAKKLNRIAIGFDIDEVNVAIVKGRVIDNAV